MARLGLKLFYLRTREREESQETVSSALGIRQATLSFIEQGQSLPTYALLLELARYFDVTPTFLMDEERGVVPLPSERWRMRHALVTTGMWIEVAPEEVVETPDGKLLCPLLPGEAFYDDEARRRRQEAVRRKHALAGKGLRRRRGMTERSLARELEGELQQHPQRRPRPGGRSEKPPAE